MTDSFGGRDVRSNGLPKANTLEVPTRDENGCDKNVKCSCYLIINLFVVIYLLNSILYSFIFIYLFHFIYSLIHNTKLNSLHRVL